MTLLVNIIALVAMEVVKVDRVHLVDCRFSGLTLPCT